MGDAYYQGDVVVRQCDADNHGASWTQDELELLRDMWRRADLIDIAERLGRTDGACNAQYYYQQSREPELRWQPPEKRFLSPGMRGMRGGGDEREMRPVRTIHDDEDRWWEPEFYTARRNTTPV